MKITSFLILFAVVQIFASGVYSQNAKISINGTKMQVSALLSEIEAKSNYLFVYNKKNIDSERIVNVDAKNKSVSQILDETFKGTGIKYVVEGNNIVLTKRSDNFAQKKDITISGVIKDNNGEPIIGANVIEKGTTNGVITNVDGKYKIHVSTSSILSISYIGYTSQEIQVKGRSVINIILNEEALQLDNVVVTAMGIKKKESSLTYSTQQIGGDELTRAKDPNMINALAGKTAGVQINKSTSGLGGSAKVIIRGNRSVSGNNQPLYVIDGVPMLNSTTEQASTAIGGTGNAGNRDGGDGISNLNPDDIESMSILKGASAAALYGSQAANGVILITTKKGKAGLQRVQFSSNLTVENAVSLPEFQNNYGINGINSYGEKKNLKDYDNLDKFFKSGVTAINSVSFTSGGEKMQTYFSYANTTGNGIVDKNELNKHNLNFRETSNLFNDALKLDANITLMQQSIKNSPTTGGFYMNPLVGLYRFPRGEDMGEYRDNGGYEVYDPQRNMYVQNWYTSTQDFEQNPYWIINRISSNDKRKRVIASLTANVKVNSWLNIQARGTADYISDKFQQKFYASTAPAIAGDNGRYIDLTYQETLYYADIMAMITKQIGAFSINGAFGASLNDNSVTSLRLDSRTASLYYPNVFTIANINMGASALIDEQNDAHKQMQSLFATAQLGWKQSVYIDVTARNDWSSTLAFTPSADKGFFYPSVGLSWIIDKSIKLPKWISFGKIRASWSKVGNDIPLYVSNPVDHITAGGNTKSADAFPFTDMKPEMSTSYEVGTEWKFLNQRLDFDLTLYKTNTKNQFFKLPSQAGDLYAYRYVNAGNIENKGIEITLGATPLMNDNFRWKTAVNFSTNKNKVVELHKDLPVFVYGDPGFSSSYLMKLVKGGSFGDIYGKSFERDENGKIKINDDGTPVITTQNDSFVGNCSPDFSLGWSNTLVYKGISVYFLIDGRFGGKVLSQTQADMDQMGVSKESGDARDRGFVEYDGQKFTNVKEFYNVVGGRNGCTEYYMYDATNIRLRELSIGYSLPKNLLAKTRFLSEAQISLVGRNLFFISKDAPFDPDTTMSTSNDNQGIDVYGMPSTRSFGFNVKLSF